MEAPTGLEPVIFWMRTRCLTSLAMAPWNGGTGGCRTLYLLHAMQALSQLSYGPIGGPDQDRTGGFQRDKLAGTPLPYRTMLLPLADHQPPGVDMWWVLGGPTVFHLRREP